MRLPLAVLLLLSAGLGGCQAWHGRFAAGAADAAGPAPATPAAQGCERLQARHPDATFLLYVPSTGRHLACNPTRARREFLPASTFKVANALIGLETGAVRDEHEVMRWDGRTRGVAAWNQDTDLAGGMRNSTVWYYQAMARRIGPARMREGVARLDYGNRDIGGDEAIDHFWLDGALRISAYGQVDFLDRLRRRALPVSARSQATTIRILERDRGAWTADGPAPWVLRAKSGMAVPIDASGDLARAVDLAPARGAEPVGWFVGWVERDPAHGGDAVFALNLRLRDTSDAALREPLARELLVANGVLPAP